MQSQIISSPSSPDPYQSSHSRWQALTHRTPSSHSSFLYGVKSTKIYCRPTCSARLARRANVIFYDSQAQALRDGFKPCKRCKPDDTTFLGEREEVATRAIALLRIKKDETIMKRSLKELANEVGVTPSYLCRVFKGTMGVTIGDYMKEFEKEVGESETTSSVQPPSKFGSGAVDVRLGLLTPATTARSLSGPVEGREGALVDEDVGTFGETFGEALDLNFDFDEWFWNEDFSGLYTSDLEPVPKAPWTTAQYS
ncbi:MAG: hypothetical protein M1835_007869 [Candelina submexicana]|nr:MAG: hypothetical protein M1835_007869 [Candelina submexicana]